MSKNLKITNFAIKLTNRWFYDHILKFCLIEAQSRVIHSIHFTENPRERVNKTLIINHYSLIFLTLLIWFCYIYFKIFNPKMTNSLYLEQYLDSLEPLSGELKRNLNSEGCFSDFCKFYQYLVCPSLNHCPCVIFQ